MFDLKKAFDSIDHDILIKKLSKTFKYHRKELLIAKWILSAASIKILEHRKKININLGCPQGNKSSPFFFNIVINDLVDDLNIINGLLVMVFADDIAILADSRIALSKGIDLIENWCKENLMSLNKNKS